MAELLDTALTSIASALRSVTAVSEVDPDANSDLLPRWTPNAHRPARERVASCTQCRLPFNLTFRRHHCRNCGLIYCHACSKTRRPIPDIGYSRAVRVCDRCVEVLDAGRPGGTQARGAVQVTDEEIAALPPLPKRAWNGAGREADAIESGALRLCANTLPSRPDKHGRVVKPLHATAQGLDWSQEEHAFDDGRVHTDRACLVSIVLLGTVQQGWPRAQLRQVTWHFFNDSTRLGDGGLRNRLVFSGFGDAKGRLGNDWVDQTIEVHPAQLPSFVLIRVRGLFPNRCRVPSEERPRTRKERKEAEVAAAALRAGTLRTASVFEANETRGVAPAPSSVADAKRALLAGADKGSGGGRDRAPPRRRKMLTGIDDRDTTMAAVRASEHSRAASNTAAAEGEKQQHTSAFQSRKSDMHQFLNRQFAASPPPGQARSPAASPPASPRSGKGRSNGPAKKWPAVQTDTRAAGSAAPVTASAEVVEEPLADFARARRAVGAIFGAPPAAASASPTRGSGGKTEQQQQQQAGGGSKGKRRGLFSRFKDAGSSGSRRGKPGKSKGKNNGKGKGKAAAGSAGAVDEGGVKVAEASRALALLFQPRPSSPLTKSRGATLDDDEGQDAAKAAAASNAPAPPPMPRTRVDPAISSLGAAAATAARARSVTGSSLDSRSPAQVAAAAAAAAEVRRSTIETQGSLTSLNPDDDGSDDERDIEPLRWRKKTNRWNPLNWRSPSAKTYFTPSEFSAEQRAAGYRTVMPIDKKSTALIPDTALTPVVDIDRLSEPVETLAYHGNVFPAAPEPLKYSLTVRAIYDYNAEPGNEDLTFRRGDVITVWQEDASGWWYGECQGRRGLFPVTFVQPVLLRPAPQWVNPRYRKAYERSKVGKVGTTERLRGVSSTPIASFGDPAKVPDNDSVQSQHAPHIPD